MTILCCVCVLAAFTAATALHTGNVAGPAADDVSWVEQLSWKPRAYVWHRFLTPAECKHLIELARPSMAVSEVVDPTTGNSVLDSVRTSSGTFLTRYQDDTVTRIEDRLAAWTQLPVDNGEDLQILQYEAGQKYDEHWDWFDAEELEKMNMSTTSNRIATVLMYLTDVEEGGETAFSQSTWLEESKQLKGSPSECAAGKVHVRPRLGDALLFWDLLPDGQTGDMNSMHASCPIIAGEKWSATKWIHSSKYGSAWEIKEKRAEETVAHIRCEDTNVQCEEWAQGGACDKNREYMSGACRKACGFCVKCAAGDIVCERKNVRLQKMLISSGGLPQEAR